MSLPNQPRQEGEFPDWEALYRNEPVQSLPWFTTEVDQDLARILAEEGITAGTFLDLGTGPGTQAAWLAAQGFRVTASDLSLSAIAAAEKYARQRGVCVAFVEDDILATFLEGPFDFIFDRGCFHVLPPAARERYVQTLHRLLAPHGRLFLKCFSARETVVRGPYRFAPQDLVGIFGSHFQVLKSWESRFEGTLAEQPLALFTVLQPRGQP